MTMINMENPGIRTYSPLGKMSSGIEGSAPGAGSFATMLKQVAVDAVEASGNQERIAGLASQGKASSLELLQATNHADLAVQEFKAYHDKFMNSFNDIIKLNM